jgi:hypothetical protein
VVFGKAEKAHPCNAQWVKIYAGLTPHSMNEVFVGNLRNDGQSELKGVRSSAWVWTGNMERKTGIKPKRRDELVSDGDFEPCRHSRTFPILDSHSALTRCFR